MNKRVMLQQMARAADGQGGYTETWTDVFRLWAEIVPLKGYERMQAMQLEVPVTHKVNIRYYPGITAKQRLVYGCRIFNIKEAIDPNEGRMFLQLTCVEMA